VQVSDLEFHFHVQQYSYYIVASSESFLSLGGNGQKAVLMRMASTIITSPKEAIISGDCNLASVGEHEFSSLFACSTA
jgi:hypothetical protein